jgi:S1-C subfamily serine protease
MAGAFACARRRPLPEPTRWAFPPSMQPAPGEVRFDLKAALDAVVGLRADVPDDAFTAPILGTERTGNGVVIGADGLVLTIGYLVTEADSIWLTANDGSVVPAHPVAYDFATGFGLVLPLSPLKLPAIGRGSAASVAPNDDVFVLGHGGRAHALRATVFAKREFAGYWEYLLDEALFTSPVHPEWSGAALVGEDGLLVGIGSLLVQEEVGDEVVKGNMFVPVDLLAPIIDDLLRTGRPAAPPRPWLGMYTAETPGGLVVNGLAAGGPADKAGIAPGDVVVAVGDDRVTGLADMYRRIWRKGPAGTEIALTVARDGAPVRATVRSGDRRDFLRKPSLQ